MVIYQVTHSDDFHSLLWVNTQQGVTYCCSYFRPTVDNKPPSKGKNRTGIIVGVIVGLGLLSILAGVGIFIIRKRRNPYTDDDGNKNSFFLPWAKNVLASNWNIHLSDCFILRTVLLLFFLAELLSMEIKPFTFTYSELKSATQDFNLSNKLEEGGFEPVYKVSPIPKYLHIRWKNIIFFPFFPISLRFFLIVNSFCFSLSGTNSNDSVFFKKLTSRGPLAKKFIQWLLSLHQIG